MKKHSKDKGIADIKPHIHLRVYPSGIRCWCVRPNRPGPWRRPRYCSDWGKAYARAWDLNQRGVCL